MKHRRCEARAFLQLHHERPWALGGTDSVDNLQLLCRAHNQLQAEPELGANRVAQAIERRRKQPVAPGDVMNEEG